jgi:hypothetical protein
MSEENETVNVEDNTSAEVVELENLTLDDLLNMSEDDVEEFKARKSYRHEAPPSLDAAHA